MSGKLAGILLLCIAVSGSTALHWWLFQPLAADGQTSPEHEPEPEEPDDEAEVPVDIVVAPPVQRDSDSPARVDAVQSPNAASVPEQASAANADHAALEAAGGQLRSDLVFDYEVGAEDDVLAFARALGLPVVLLELARHRTWRIRIDAAGTVTPLSPSGGRAWETQYVVLPTRSNTARRTRYAEWRSRARRLCGIPVSFEVELALALPDDRLATLARQAVLAHCSARGIAPDRVRRAALRPVLEGGRPVLLVTSVGLAAPGSEAAQQR